jgi:phospholipid/cholesterol/gamma-HCH transport system permease protein
MMTDNPGNISFLREKNRFVCDGDWSVLNLGSVSEQLKSLKLPHSEEIKIDGQSIQKFDSAGGLTLVELIRQLEKKKNIVSLENFDQEKLPLIKLIRDKKEIFSYKTHGPDEESFLAKLGKQAVAKVKQLEGLVILIGDLAEKLFYSIVTGKGFRFSSIVSNIYSSGITALPIIALLSFLIGVVLAYQMGLQLESYGANIFIAYLSGMAIFREFSPLITAIIVAGRTSSAFTAQIGSMKINEELDALCTMGLSPTELLVVPKVLGLLVFFPLLIFWSDFFSTLGAMIMAKVMLNVGYQDFLGRLSESVGFKQMALGLYKAPTFALLIALVGCFQGFRVVSNADSVGIQTTKSVVQALFLIIIADAIYSIIYSWLNL